MQAKVVPWSLDFSPDGKLMALFSHPDRIIRIFKVWSGKLWKKLDEETFESINAAQSLSSQPPDSLTPAQASKAAMYQLDTIDFGRRMAIEMQERQAGGTGAAMPAAGGQAE